MCAHPQRAAIEKLAEKAKGGELAELAVRFEVSARALERHVDAHPRAPVPKPKKAPPAPKAERTVRAPSPAAEVLEDDEEAPATSRSVHAPRELTSLERVNQLLDLLHRLGEDVAKIGAKTDAGDEDDPFTAAMWAKERIAVARAMVAPIKLLSQLRGELGASEATVVASPYFKRMVTIILEALRPHAAARQAVIEALEREQRGGRVEAAA